ARTTCSRPVPTGRVRTDRPRFPRRCSDDDAARRTTPTSVVAPLPRNRRPPGPLRNRAGSCWLARPPEWLRASASAAWYPPPYKIAASHPPAEPYAPVKNAGGFPAILCNLGTSSFVPRKKAPRLTTKERRRRDKGVFDVWCRSPDSSTRRTVGFVIVGLPTDII